MLDANNKGIVDVDQLIHFEEKIDKSKTIKKLYPNKNKAGYFVNHNVVDQEEQPQPRDERLAGVRKVNYDEMQLKMKQTSFQNNNVQQIFDDFDKYDEL